jgi:hypothetical protein
MRTTELQTALHAYDGPPAPASPAPAASSAAAACGTKTLYCGLQQPALACTNRGEALHSTQRGKQQGAAHLGLAAGAELEEVGAEAGVTATPATAYLNNGNWAVCKGAPSDSVGNVFEKKFATTTDLK